MKPAPSWVNTAQTSQFCGINCAPTLPLFAFWPWGTSTTPHALNWTFATCCFCTSGLGKLFSWVLATQKVLAVVFPPGKAFSISNKCVPGVQSHGRATSTWGMLRDVQLLQEQGPSSTQPSCSWCLFLWSYDMRTLSQTQGVENLHMRTLRCTFCQVRNAEDAHPPCNFYGFCKLVYLTIIPN